MMKTDYSIPKKQLKKTHILPKKSIYHLMIQDNEKEEKNLNVMTMDNDKDDQWIIIKNSDKKSIQKYQNNKISSISE